MALKGLPANSPIASVSATVLKDRSPPAPLRHTVHCVTANDVDMTLAICHCSF
jgi:hypothetical protein